MAKHIFQMFVHEVFEARAGVFPGTHSTTHWKHDGDSKHYRFVGRQYIADIFPSQSIARDGPIASPAICNIIKVTKPELAWHWVLISLFYSKLFFIC